MSARLAEPPSGARAAPDALPIIRPCLRLAAEVVSRVRVAIPYSGRDDVLYRARLMQLAANLFDVWTFRRTAEGPRFLLLYTSMEKAERFFNGGRFWQIPSNFVKEGEHITDAIARHLRSFGLKSRAIWAAEHTYTIYNRRFNEMQLIGVYAAEVTEAALRLNASEHAEAEWLTAEECLARVHFRGLKDGLRSVLEYVTGPATPAPELCLYSEDA